MDHLAHESVEQLAALILVLGGGLFIALSLLTMRRRTAPSSPGDSPSVRRSLDLALAGLSAGAAVIHLAAAPSHYAEIGALAAGFLISAAFQAAWARWCLAGPSRRAVAIGIVGNLAIVVAWAYTRTIGLPVGEFAGAAEPIGYPDAASVLFELLIVAGLIIRRLGLDNALSSRPVARSIASVMVVPVVGLVLVLSSLATVAIASGLEHGAPDGVPAAHVATH